MDGSHQPDTLSVHALIRTLTPYQPSTHTILYLLLWANVVGDPSVLVFKRNPTLEGDLLAWLWIFSISIFTSAGPTRAFSEVKNGLSTLHSRCLNWSNRIFELMTAPRRLTIAWWTFWTDDIVGNCNSVALVNRFDVMNTVAVKCSPLNSVRISRGAAKSRRHAASHYS